MKNQKEIEKTVVFNGREWYIKKIVEIISQSRNETMLKKIYTFTKTLNDISKEEGV